MQWVKGKMRKLIKKSGIFSLEKDKIDKVFTRKLLQTRDSPYPKKT